MMFIRVKKNIRHIIYWLVSVILSAVLLLLTGLYSLTDDTKAALQFIWNYRIIKENYFRTTSDEKLFENATLGMISALDDPHSALLSGKKFDLFSNRQVENTVESEWLLAKTPMEISIFYRFFLIAALKKSVYNQKMNFSLWTESQFSVQNWRMLLSV